MGRQRCKSCLALLGVCLISCRAQSDAHDHSAELSDTTLGQPSQESSSDFTSWLGQESPAVHVQHMYQESGSSDTVFAWMLDASRGGCGAMVEGVSLDAAHAHDADGGDAAVDEASGAADSDHADHAELDGHAGHAHRRMLDHAGHEHDEEEDDAHDHAAESGADVASSMRVLSVESLDALNASAESGEAAVRGALAYITACLVDPSCVLEGGSIMPTTDDHDGHGGHGNSDASKHIGLKLALAAAFLVMTVATSYLPLVFMWSSNYYGILTCLNVFSGSVFLSVGLMHLLPHVADYEEAAALTSNYPVGNAFVILGFLLVLFMEQVVFDVHGSEVKERDAEAKASAKYTLMTRATTLAQRYHSPLLTEGAVVLHAVLECIVLGLSGSREDIWLLFAAICSHKVFTTMSQSARFLRLGCPPGLLFVLLLPFHILPPLGVVIGAVTGRENAAVSLVLAGLATGTFLYVGAFEVVAEEFADAGHGAPGAAASANGTTACFRSAGSGCIGAPVTEDDMDGSDSTAGADPKAWIPGRLLKFVIFVSGCGMLLAVTAALPAHSEIHDH